MSPQIESKLAEPRPPMQLSMIVAMDRNGLIGNGNRLPVRLPSDLRRFRIVTSNKPVIMGRKTHESIGKVLPTRTNIVITRDEDLKTFDEVIVTNNLVDAYNAAYATGASHAFVIGGAEIYRQFLPLCTRIYMTLIDDEFEGDVYFPIQIKDVLSWKSRVIQLAEKSDLNPHGHTFQIIDIPPIDDLADYYEV